MSPRRFRNSGPRTGSGKQPAPHLARGAQAEAAAAAWLKQRGLAIVERNWRCRFGEIDLVLRDGDTLVFAEVRLRGNPLYGGAAASIDRRKRLRLAAAANLFLAAAPQWRSGPCRFDAVLMSAPDGSEIEWIRNAFEV